MYLYDRSPAFVRTCADAGCLPDQVADLTPEQVLGLSQKVAVMVTPAEKGEPQLLRLDTPRWCFKQR